MRAAFVTVAMIRGIGETDRGDRLVGRYGIGRVTDRLPYDHHDQMEAGSSRPQRSMTCVTDASDETTMTHRSTLMMQEWMDDGRHISRNPTN
jgi:hypothetical protein